MCGRFDGLLTLSGEQAQNRPGAFRQVRHQQCRTQPDSQMQCHLSEWTIKTFDKIEQAKREAGY
jgi:hypothetical protein